MPNLDLASALISGVGALTSAVLWFLKQTIADNRREHREMSSRLDKSEEKWQGNFDELKLTLAIITQNMNGKQAKAVKQSSLKNGRAHKDS